MDRLQPLNFSTIPRYSETPIVEIPKYVFENCNQVTCHDYKPAYLDALRKRVVSITKSEIHEMTKGNPEKETTFGEECDWVYGLDRLEKEFLDQKEAPEALLTIENVIEINSWFSRMCNDQLGQYRTEGIRWPKATASKSLTPLGYTTMEIFEYVILIDIKKKHSECSEKELLSKQVKYLSEISDPFEESKTVSFHIEDCLAVYDSFMELGLNSNTILQYQGQNFDKDFKPTLKKHFVQVQKENRPNKRDKTHIDIAKYIHKHVHYFPCPEGLVPQLSKCLKTIQNPEMHPIEKASRIWFEVVRLHISHEANKRTGKALGSVILLHYGYLPPLIDKESTDAYVQCLSDTFEEKEGVTRFTQFIAQKIFETQEKMKKLEIV